MAREEKQLELLLDSVLNRLNDLKIAISSMIHKIETQHETINWPTFLDNFALISSHVGDISSLAQFQGIICYLFSVDRLVQGDCQRNGSSTQKSDCASITAFSGTR